MSEIMKTLIWNLLFFSFLPVFAKKPVQSITDLYQQTSRIYQLSKEGKALKVIILCDSVINSYKDFPGSETYLGYLYIYLADAAKRQGDIGLARNSLQLAGRFFKSGGDELMVQIPVNLISLDLEAGRFDRCLSKGLPLLKEKAFVLDPAKSASLLNNLAAAALQTNNLKLTDSLFHCLFELIHKKTTGANFDSALTYRNFGRFKLKIGDLKTAGPAIRRSLELYQQQYGPVHFQTGKSWHNLGNFYKQSNRLDSAKLCYLSSRRSFNINISVSNPLGDVTTPFDYQTVSLELLMDEINLQRIMAFQQRDSFRVDKLLAVFKNALGGINHFESILQLLTGSESGFILSDKGRQVFNAGIQLSIDLYRETGKEVYLQKALVLAMQSGAISLQAQAVFEEQMVQDDSTQSLVLQLYRFRESLDKPSDRYSRLNQLQGYQNQMRILKRRTNNLKILTGPNELRFDQIARAIGKSQFICYQQLDSALIVFGLSNNHLSFSEIPICNDLRTTLTEFMKVVDTPIVGNYQNEQVNEFYKKAINLYHILLKPYLVKNLSGKLLIRSDGILLDLPFEALVFDDSGFEASDSLTEFSNLPFLMKKFCISYVSGTRQETIGKIQSKHSQSLKILTWSYDQLAPELKVEVDWLKENVPHSIVIDLGEPGCDIKTSLKDADLIHFAGHIRINYEDAMRTSMGYPLKREGSFDLSNLLHIRISSRMAFINGCESGKGIYNRGDGELSPGLFFLLAGASGVIEHRWKAPDLSGSFLSREFYSEHPEDGPAIALQKAKLDYLTKCQPGLDHPHYWAGMVYAGPIIIVQFQTGTILLFAIILLLLFLAIWYWIRKSQYKRLKRSKERKQDNS